MLTTVLLVVAGVLAGVVAALKVIAPLTRSKVDDKILGYAETAEDLVDEAKGARAPAAPAPATK